jgi:hypothetical protein
MVIRFPVDLSKLLRYLEGKREETGVEVTFTHLAIKAAAVSVSETTSLNGHVLYGYFYKSKTAGCAFSCPLYTLCTLFTFPLTPFGSLFVLVL